MKLENRGDFPYTSGKITGPQAVDKIWSLPQTTDIMSLEYESVRIAYFWIAKKIQPLTNDCGTRSQMGTWKFHVKHGISSNRALDPWIQLSIIFWLISFLFD